MVTINANAKINLTLDILGKRTDGYHEVSMVMQSINLFDTLTFTKLDAEEGIILHGDVKGVAANRQNTCRRQRRVGRFARIHIVDAAHR